MARRTAIFKKELRIRLEPLPRVTSTFRTPLYEREFPLSRNFYVGTNVNVSCLNIIETMYEKSHEDAKVE